MPEKVTTVTDAVNPTDPMGHVYFFGAKVKPDVVAEMIDADYSASTDQTSQISMTFVDPDFDRLATGIYVPKIPVNFEDYRLEVASVETGESNGQETLTVNCRPRIVRKLKERRGRKVLKNASPSDFVKQECKAVGAGYVVQDTAKRKQVARDVKGSGETGNPDDRPSSWTTFQRFASEVGFVCFEQAGTIYFGKPSWLLEQSKNNDTAVLVNWGKGDPHTWPLNVPSCNKSVDSVTTSVSCNMPINYWKVAKVGKALKLDGIPGFNGYYLITGVEYPLIGATTISITAGTPEDPDPQGWKKPASGSGKKRSVTTTHGSGGVGGGSYTGGRNLRAFLHAAGFSGEGLEIAIAVCMAESGGDAHAVGDVSLANSKWGPSIGLFQIRSLRHPSSYGGWDKYRDASKLRSAPYNARLAYHMSNGGRSWGAWSTYTSGAYRRYYRTNQNYTVKNWVPPKPTHTEGRSGGLHATGRRGTKSAMDFVYFALRQAGDRYVYGAEANLHDPNPGAFDCSELVQWAAAQTGVFVPDGSYNQQSYTRRRAVSVAQAHKIRGALLFWGSPAHHVAISLGNGSTIEALNPSYGVRVMGPGRSFAWTNAGLIPGMRY